MTDQSATTRGTEVEVLLAFAGVVVFGGLNVVAVSFSNRELPPFFGAGLRFAATAVVFWLVFAIRRTPFPRGRALLGSVLYGFFGFTVALGLAYLELQELPASVGGVIIAAVPLFTLLLAALQGLESLHWRGVAGGLLGIAGIAVLLYSPSGKAIPIVSALAMAGAALGLSQAGIVVKKYPPCHPVAMNSVGVTVGAVAMLALSLLVGEEWTMPTETATWLAVVYLVILGSVAVFALYIFVLHHWTASRAAYQFVLMPFVSAAASIVLLDESLTAGLIVGGLIVVAGIYLGALSAQPAQPAQPPDQEALALRCSGG